MDRRFWAGDGRCEALRHFGLVPLWEEVPWGFFCLGEVSFLVCRGWGGWMVDGICVRPAAGEGGRRRRARYEGVLKTNFKKTGRGLLVEGSSQLSDDQEGSKPLLFGVQQRL